MDEDIKLEKLRSSIREYSPIVLFDPVTSVIFTTNKLTLQRIAAYSASLQNAKRTFSWRELKKPFLQALWKSYGRGF